MDTAEKRNMLFYIYLTTFLTTIGFALIIYINSSFLQKYIRNEYIGLIYGVSSILALISLVQTPHILKRIGLFKITLAVLILEAISMLGMSVVDFYSHAYKNISTPLQIVYLSISALSLFLLFRVSATLLRFTIDLYLEKYTTDLETGRNRGVLLTIMNIAVAISPYLVGKILTDGDFWKVYLLSSIVFLPAIYLLWAKLSKIEDVDYHDAKFLPGLKKIIKNKNIYSIFMSNFLLQFFYSWMTIYVPLYLFKTVGFSWETIGTMFSIMLTSFVILQLPLGKIADTILGEKEILTAGFIIAGLSTMYLAFIDGPLVLTWTVALFSTRVGAAAIEIMTETYFFKKVSPSDSDIISFFRNAAPMAYIIGPTLASVILYFTDFRSMFVILGGIMLMGTKYSMSIKDTL